jgi:hypothetical protein
MDRKQNDRPVFPGSFVHRFLSARTVYSQQRSKIEDEDEFEDEDD